MNQRELPIGFFDSGIGGVSVLAHAVSILKNEDYIYWGDNANAPYGNKSEDEIMALSLACGEALMEKGVKALVMACNTATSISVKMLRERYQVPVISIEPAVKPAIENCAHGKVLVMATPATISQQRYQNLVARLGCRSRVIDMPCGGLVERIEPGDFTAPEIREYLHQKFAPLRGEEISGIVVGCTHYSFISDAIADVAKEYFLGNCEIFDGMFGMVRQLKRVLEQQGLRSTRNRSGKVTFFSSAGEKEIEILSRVFDAAIRKK